MPTRLPITAAAALLMLGGSVMAQLPGLTPGSRPALLTTSPVNQVLPADSAFVLDVQLLAAPAGLQLHWDIAPDYYLYRKSLKLLSASGTQVPLELPAGEAIEDEFFGAVEVYYGALTATAATDLLAGNGDSLHLVVEYQGCAADRYCYPPQRQELQLPLP